MDPQLCGDTTSEEELLKQYFNKGFKYDVILGMLQEYHGIHMSRSTLLRRFKAMNLKRRNSVEDLDVHTAVLQEIAENGNTKGYRQMTSVVRQGGIQCSRQQVAEFLRVYDPEISSERRTKRLKRRLYNCSAPGALWHADGNDKLKRYGFAIHGAIDGYSRKLMWLKVSSTNNNPNVIAGYYLDAVTTWGVPSILRTDCGTENGIMAGIQINMTRDISSHIYGKSTANQRIEALWSVLRPAVIDNWKTFFQGLFDGTVNEVDDEQIAVLRFCFMELLQNSLNVFMRYWNSHNVCASADMPGGVPDVLFYASETKLIPAAGDIVSEAMSVCHVDPVTGSQFYDNALSDLMEFHQLEKPKNKEDAIILFTKLLDLLNA